MIVTHNASLCRFPLSLDAQTDTLTLQHTAIQAVLEEDVEMLERLTQLHSFSFTDNQVSCWDLRRLLATLTDLCSYVNLANNACLYYQSVLEETTHFPRNLLHLNLSGNNISLFPMSSCLKQCEQLRTLWLSDNCLKDLALVNEIRHTHLQELVLQHNRFEFPPSCLASLPQLTMLDLSYNQLQSLLNINANTALHTINLQCNKLSYSYAALINALPPNIKQLNLSNNPLLYGLLPQGLPPALLITQQCNDVVVEIIPHFYYCSNPRNYQLLAANKINSLLSVYGLPSPHTMYLQTLDIKVHRLNCRHEPLFNQDISPMLANVVTYITKERQTRNVGVAECVDLLWLYLMASEPAQFSTFNSAASLLRAKGFRNVEQNTAMVSWVLAYTQQAAPGCAVC